MTEADSDPRTGEGRSARAANIFDVARLAGVSHQTVSRVINSVPNVRPATRSSAANGPSRARVKPPPSALAAATRAAHRRIDRPGSDQSTIRHSTRASS